MSEPTAIEALPPETLTQVFEALDARSLGRAAQACRLWRRLADPIARSRDRFRDPGFARIAVDDAIVHVLAVRDDVFVGIGVAEVLSWDARGRRVASPADPGMHWTLTLEPYADATTARGTFTTREGESATLTTTHSAPLDVAHSVEIARNVVRVRDADREIVAEFLGYAFAILDETIAIESIGGGLSFWSCPKK